MTMKNLQLRLITEQVACWYSR